MDVVFARGMRTLADVLRSTSAHVFSNVAKALYHEGDKNVAHVAAVSARKETDTFSMMVSSSPSGTMQIKQQSVTITGTGAFPVTYQTAKRIVITYISYRFLNGTYTITTGSAHVTKNGTDIARVVYSTVGNNNTVNVYPTVLEPGDSIVCTVSCSAHTANGAYEINLMYLELD